MQQSTEERLARLADRLDIQEVLYRYARGVDRRDWELVRSVYHVDAWDDHGNYKGDVDSFIENLKKRHAFIEQSMHVVTNCIIEFDGPDSAVVESYYITYQRLLPGAGQFRLNYLSREPLGDDDAMQGQAIGRYVDRFERRDGTWRIARRTVVFEVYRGSPTVPGGGLKPNWVTPRRDGDDAIEQLLAEKGLAKKRPPSA
jgi:hypothetical protein